MVMRRHRFVKVGHGLGVGTHAALQSRLTLSLKNPFQIIFENSYTGTIDNSK